MKNPLAGLGNALARMLFGISPEEIRFTFQDVRNELHALRAETQDEIASLRKELEAERERKGEEAELNGTPLAEA